MREGMSVSFSPSASLCLSFSLDLSISLSLRQWHNSTGSDRRDESTAELLHNPPRCYMHLRTARFASPFSDSASFPLALLAPRPVPRFFLLSLPPSPIPLPTAVVSSLLSAYSPIVFDNFSTAVRLMPMRSANLSVRFMQRRVAYVYINIDTYTRAVRRALYAPARTTGHYVDASEHI